MNVLSGFFILLFLAILVRYLGNKSVPLLMPSGRLKTVALGFMGGLLGNILARTLWEVGPVVGGVYLLVAAIGTAIFILGLGLVPFVKILLGRV